MVITRYKVKGPKLKVAVVADLHGEYSTELIEALKTEKPDIIAWIAANQTERRDVNAWCRN